MADTDTKPVKRRKGAGFWAAVVLALLVLYVTSSGPVHYLGMRGQLSVEVMSAIDLLYAPLGMMTQLPVVGELLQWWFRLWD